MTTAADLSWPKEPFKTWLRRESWKALKWSAALLVVGFLGILAFRAVLPNGYWQRLNYQLTHTALSQHPVALVRTFASRLGESEYGWKPLSLSAPFNITAAAQELQNEYAEFIGVSNGTAKAPRATALRRANPQQYDARAAAYVARYEQIQSARFKRLYAQEDLFSPPDENAALGRVVTKILGFPDAFIHTLRSIVLGGVASILLFSTVLAFAGVALWQAHRPARLVLKLILWPWLASALIWIAILVMSVSAALFGAFTPNTSALALVTLAPFLFLAAKIPSRLSENWVHRAPPAPASKPWDGIERRKPRPPAPDTTTGGGSI